MFIPYIQLHYQKTKILYYKKYSSILNALERNNVSVNFQCRTGYCGICRISLIYGTIKYFEQPLACVKKFEILICCCYPITNIQLSL